MPSMSRHNQSPQKKTNINRANDPMELPSPVFFSFFPFQMNLALRLTDDSIPLYHIHFTEKKSCPDQPDLTHILYVDPHFTMDGIYLNLSTKLEDRQQMMDIFGRMEEDILSSYVRTMGRRPDKPRMYDLTTAMMEDNKDMLHISDVWESDDHIGLRFTFFSCNTRFE